MKIFTLSKTLSIICITLIITACSITKAPEIAKTYEAKDFEKPLNSFLIIGAGKNTSNNSLFEHRLRDKLKAQGFEAYGALSSFDKGVKLNRETAIALAKKLGVDGILVTRLVAMESELKDTKRRSEYTVKRDPTRNFSDYFRIEYTEIETKIETDIVTTVILATDLYVMGREDRVLGMESTSFKKMDIETVISEVTTKVISELKREGVL
jgi:hypothetical protein